MKKYFLLSACSICVLIFAGCNGEKSAGTPSVVKEVASVTKVLAIVSDEAKPRPAITPAMHTPLEPAALQVMFSESGGGVAYIAEKEGKSYVVHNGKPGKLYASIGDIALSPDGRRIAYGALVDGKWQMVTDGNEGSNFDAVESPLFSPDSRHIAYKAMLGDKWFVVVDKAVNSGTKTSYTRIEFNADSTLIAYFETADEKSRERLNISDLGFKRQKVMDGIGSLMITNDTKTRIAAVSLENGKQRLIECSFSSPDDVKKGALYDSISKPYFGPDGVSLAYEALRGKERLLVFNGREVQISNRHLVDSPVIRPDLKAVGAILGDVDPASQHLEVSSAGNAAGMYEFFVNDSRKGKEYDEARYLVYNRDGSSYAHAARRGQSWFVVVNGQEGPGFDRVVTPKFSPDGQCLVYRVRKDGKRFVVVADTTGRTIRTHPAYEQVFDVVFTADGKSMAYGVKDGNKLIWKVEKL